MNFVRIDRKDRTAIVRFGPGDGRNLLNAALMAELAEAARRLDADDGVTAVVLAGDGGAFSYGYDLAEAQAHPPAEEGLAAARRRARAGRDMCLAWARMEALTVAAIERWAVGGGAALAAACDLRVMGSDATYWVPEIARGLNMSWGSVPRIAALTGPARAKRIVVLGEKVPAATAEAWGLADAVSAPGGALDAALELAERAAALPPVQTRMAKMQVEQAVHPLAEALSFMDADQFALARTSEDHAEAVAAFLEKRPPRYTGR